MRSSLVLLAGIFMVVVASWMLRRSQRRKRTAGPWPIMLAVLGGGLVIFVAVESVLHLLPGTGG